MPTISRPGVSIHYETIGPEDGRPLVLIAGLGEQIGGVEFPEEHCRQFVEAGFRVIRMDNRDSGLSLPEPDLGARDIMATFGAARSGHPVLPDYTIQDMADDVIAVVDALGLSSVDVLGASLGGFIARWVAIRNPQRVRSLTIVMSGSGAPTIDPLEDERVLGRLISMTIPRDRASAIEHAVSDWRSYWGSVFPFDEQWTRTRCTYAYDRSYRPEGIGRMLIGVGMSPSLFEFQSEIACPTLIMHGDVDPIFNITHAEAAKDKIASSELWIVEGMGHSMPNELWPEMARRVASLGD